MFSPGWLPMIYPVGAVLWVSQALCFGRISMIDGIVYFHRNSGISSWFSTLFITRLSIRSPSVVRCSLQYCFLHHGSGSAITRPRIPVIYNGYILCCLTLCMQ
ncbi:MAG: hypothetical protein NXY57DRAFT_541265 [Lentinula lateritia]|nr:MAG: hypothetical protein NXY57DRAFT_541265 [Lentinula lateritia]